MAPGKIRRKPLLDSIPQASSLKDPTMADVEILNAIRVVAARIDDVIEPALDEISDRTDEIINQQDQIIDMLEGIVKNEDFDVFMDEIKKIGGNLKEHKEFHLQYETPIPRRFWIYAKEHAWSTAFFISGFLATLPWLVGLSRIIFIGLLSKFGIDLKTTMPQFFGF